MWRRPFDARALFALTLLLGAGVLEGCADDVPGPSEEEPVDLSARFVSDFRDHLDGYYAEHAADIESAGGAGLEAAKAAVSTEEVVEIVDAAEDPFGHDLNVYRVLSHPDVVYPGSDIWWFGAYVRESDELAEIYSFN